MYPVVNKEEKQSKHYYGSVSRIMVLMAGEEVVGEGEEEGREGGSERGLDGMKEGRWVMVLVVGAENIMK